MNDYEVDGVNNSDENSANVKASFPCDKCDETFGSRQELKEHGIRAHQLL